MVPEGEGEKPKPGGVKGKDKKSVQAPTAVNHTPDHTHCTYCYCRTSRRRLANVKKKSQ